MIREKKIYDSIDIMKFICAVLVVAIHTSPLLEVNSKLTFGITQIIARVAVPFFFVSTGYFFTTKLRNTEDNKMVLLKYLNRLIKLYIGWSAIYFIYDILHEIENSSNIMIGIVKYIRKFVFIGSHFHLWYMPALITGLILLYVSFVNDKTKIFFWLSVGMYAIGLLGDSYYGLIPDESIINNIFKVYFKLFGTTRNGLFFAFIYIMIGAIINLQLQKNSSRYYLVISVSCFTLLILEACILELHYIPKDHNMYVMLAPFTYFFFKYLISLDVNLKGNLAYSLRSYSMGIYFIHGIFLIMFSKLWGFLGITTIYTINFILVVTCSIVSIWVIKKFQVPFLKDLVN